MHTTHLVLIADGVHTTHLGTYGLLHTEYCVLRHQVQYSVQYQISTTYNHICIHVTNRLISQFDRATSSCSKVLLQLQVSNKLRFLTCPVSLTQCSVKSLPDPLWLPVGLLLPPALSPLHCLEWLPATLGPPSPAVPLQSMLFPTQTKKCFWINAFCLCVSAQANVMVFFFSFSSCAEINSPDVKPPRKTSISERKNSKSAFVPCSSVLSGCNG